MASPGVRPGVSTLVESLIINEIGSLPVADRQGRTAPQFHTSSKRETTKTVSVGGWVDQQLHVADVMTHADPCSLQACKVQMGVSGGRPVCSAGQHRRAPSAVVGLTEQVKRCAVKHLSINRVFIDLPVTRVHDGAVLTATDKTQPGAKV